MAKEPKSYSHVAATEALEQLGQRGTTATELVYDLLRIFANYGDGMGFPGGRMEMASTQCKDVQRTYPMQRTVRTL